MRLHFRKVRKVATSIMLVGFLSATGLPDIWAAPSEAAFILSRISGSPGGEVEVTVSLLGNPGIAGFSLRIHFDDEVLAPIYASRNNLLGGEVFVSNANEISVAFPQAPSVPEWGFTTPASIMMPPTNSTMPHVTAVWGSSINMFEEELFTIRFSVNDNAPAGQSLVSVSVMDLMNENGTNVFAEVQYGYVYISQSIAWGNVTESGTVGISDLTRLAQHLAEIPGRELTGNALQLADVNRDGRVDVADMILLAQHLADPDNVVLGLLG